MISRSARCSVAIKPEPFIQVRLIFANGLVQPGYWTGEGWVIHGRVADPVHWETNQKNAAGGAKNQ